MGRIVSESSQIFRIGTCSVLQPGTNPILLGNASAKGSIVGRGRRADRPQGEIVLLQALVSPDSKPSVKIAVDEGARVEISSVSGR